MNKKNSTKPTITHALITKVLFTAIGSICLIGIIWTWIEYSGLQVELKSMRETLLIAHKELIKNEVDKVTTYIKFKKGQVDKQLRYSIKERVYEAHDIASNIIEQYGGIRQPSEVREIIKEVLRPIRFNNGRGYYFAFNLEGIEELFADKPEMEGKDLSNLHDVNGQYVIRDMIDIAQNKGEDFYAYTWTRPNTEGHFPKIAFIKLLKPLNWVIGAGEYTNDVEHDIQTEVIEYIEQISYRSGGYVFAGRWDGVSLTNPGKGKNMINVTDSNGVKIVQELIRIAKAGSGYIEYVMPKMDRERPASKLAYAVGIPEWNWYVGTGMYLDEIESAIEQKKIAVEKQIFQHVLKIFFILVALVLLISFFAIRVAKKSKANIALITDFFTKAATESISINPDLINFAEFEILADSANEMIRARHQAKEKLRESEGKYRSMMESMIDLAYICSRDFTIEYMNPSMIQRIGYDATGEFCYKGIHGFDQKCPWCVHEKVSMGRSITEEVLSPLDKKTYIVSNSPIFHTDGSISKLTVFRDITEIKKMETRIQQAQKMESIGTLAGGIAHDFNNILFPIVGHTEMLLEDVPVDSPIRESLNEIYTGSLRARDLVQQILSFSRQGSSELKLIKMQPIIKEALKLIRSSIPTTISINQNIESKCGAIKADPTQIHQIVMNLATNAYHAMEESGGELSVGLKEIDLSQDDLTSPDMTPGLYACLIVADTGKGMNNDVMNKIFEPFFTTKEKGKGTGMGLSVVHGIVKSMNGEIQVYSEPGKGTEFHVYLPVIKTSSLKEETRTNDPIQGGTESVLLVDDEEGIIAMEKQALERLGYHVTSRTSSLEALEAFRTRPKKFDLIITDMTMPKMPGDKLAAELIKIRPDIPILLCTGFSESMTEEKIKSIGIKALLMKPIVIKDLAQTIRKVLD